MGNNLVKRHHVELDFSQLTDQQLHDLVAAAKQAAPASQLVTSNSVMQTCLTNMLAKDAALTQAGTTVASDRAKLATDLATEATCRSDLCGEVRAYCTLAENGAKSPADLQGAGLTPRAPVVKKVVPPDVPAGIDTIQKKGHGAVKVAVHETGSTHGQYVAQFSPDPYGPTTWAALGTGLGRTRLVTGASGTKVWVRFAAVRGQLQSDWCTPVLVTIP
jgi:hypothetical protein